ncbi:hypothetical protein Tco_1363764, partial [Tanacetum coccineum]
NMSYLTDYEEIYGGYVAFGGNPKGGKITRKGTQSNGFVDTKASDNADPKSSQDDGSKPSSDDGKAGDLVSKRIERICELKNKKRAVWNKNRQSDLVSKRIERICELKNRKRVEYIKNRQSVWTGIGVNAVNAARHNLLLLVKVNAARHKLTTAGDG